ncbi:MAG: ABC transporter ATP-binding protein [bacterium]
MEVIKTRAIGKIYKGYKGFLRKRELEALKEVNIEIKEGEVFGLLGLNAAGKSTLLKIFLGLIFPTQGEFEILGEAEPSTKLKERIGFLPEDPSLYGYLSARELLDFCGKLFRMNKASRRKRAMVLLDLVGLAKDKETRIREFSRGMVQRLGIAMALTNDPELIFLDEPLSGLDPVGRRKVKDIILELKKRGKTIFLSSHILAEAEEICDRVGILHEGKLICLKEIREIRKKNASLEEFFLQQVKENQKIPKKDSD